jgi:hypothetical protein
LIFSFHFEIFLRIYLSLFTIFAIPIRLTCRELTGFLPSFASR